MMQKLSESVLDKFSMDFLRNQVLKNAYGNDDTVIAKRDPRILLIWYLFFGLVPWFVNDLPFLLGCFLLVMVTTVLAKVAGLVLLLFAVGVFTQTGYLLIATWIFGGDASAIAPLFILTLKVATISLASVTVFSGLDPDRLFQRPDVVWLSGTAFIFNFLCLPDAAYAYGRISECPAFLQAAGKSSGS